MVKHNPISMLEVWYSILIVHAILAMQQLYDARHNLDVCIFTIVNIISSICPRIDFYRICIVHNAVSTALVGRTLSTIAHVAVANQLERVTHLSMIPLFIYAEVFCWASMVMKQPFFQIIADCLWAIAGLRTMYYFNQKKMQSMAFAAAFFSSYMITIDIPMYSGRASTPITFMDGLKEIGDCTVTHDWSKWEQDSVWMMAYYIGGTQTALYLN
jgi:hypothetical protein